MSTIAIVLIVMTFVVPSLCILGDDPKWERNKR